MVVTDPSAPALTLTDDELAALAIDARATWRGALPTLAQNDAADIEAGVTRGFRSLVARRLLSGAAGVDGDKRPLAAVRRVAGRVPAVVAYAASAESLLVPRGTVVSVFAVRDSAEYLIDVCLPGGIHDLVIKPRQDARQLVAGMVEAAVGAQGEDPTAVVFLSTCAAEPVIVTVAVGHSRWATLPPDGSEPVELEECADPTLASLLALP